MTEPTPTPQMNRRRSRRVKAKKTTKVITFKGPLGLGQNVALSILDLSETGIRLLVKEQLANDQEVQVLLESLGHRRPVKVPGKVVWSVPTADGNHCVGVAFGAPIPYGDFTQLIVS